jgi:tRNA pseudouridine38-40 synthase
VRYFLKLSYDGTDYHGWQKQPDSPTIQETIERCLEKLFSRQVHCQGCGRTDRGVHAKNFYAHIDIEQLPGYDLVFRLNKMLPADIRIDSIIPVDERAHAQYDAVSRTYEYHLHTQKNPFLSRFSTNYSLNNDQLKSIEQASSLIKNYEDFKMLCRQPDTYKHTRCNIYEVHWQIANSGEEAFLRIKANRFLRCMIRLIVARLIEVAKGEISLDDWKGMLSGQMPMKFRGGAYPQGLHLVDVQYTYI